MLNAVISLQECYNLLQKHQISVSQEDVERVDILRYMWLKLRAQVSEVQNTLLQVQPQFKATLLDNVQTFRQEVGSFIGSYTTVSQGVPTVCEGGGWGVGEGGCEAGSGLLHQQLHHGESGREWVYQQCVGGGGEGGVWGRVGVREGGV